ncbi:MAG: outer membrane protein [Devosia sp.]
MNKFVLAAALLGSVFASSAQAADLIIDDVEPAIAVSTSASGFYVGIYGGLASAKLPGIIDSSELPGFPEDAEIFPDDYESGAAYGALIGFATEVDGLVFGIEADIGGSTVSAYAADDDASDWATHDLNWVGTLRGIVGAEVADGTTIYATGGVAAIGSTLTASNDDGDEVGSADLVSMTYVVGAGVEQDLSEQFSVRLEGLYFGPSSAHEFGDEELTPDQDEGDYAKLDGMFQVRASALFRF